METGRVCGNGAGRCSVGTAAGRPRCGVPTNTAREGGPGAVAAQAAGERHRHSARRRRGITRIGEAVLAASDQSLTYAGG